MARRPQLRPDSRRPHLRRPHPLRSSRRRQRLLTVKAIRENLVSLAGLITGVVTNPAGLEIGHLVDVVARWDGEEPYPSVTGLVVRVGRRLAFVSIDQIAEVTNERVQLGSARLDLVDFARRPGEVMLARDVVDHQLVDVDGVQVIRAADLYLARVGGTLRLVGADVSLQTLLRRLGPKRWRGRPTPERVIDWAAIQPFSGEVPNVRLRASHEGLHQLRPGELADLLEDLGRPARQELLDALEPEAAADALEEMDPEELGALLRETPPEKAAALIANMEPDEAVDALRELDDEDREELLEHMDEEQREEFNELLEYKEDRAGGIMTTHVIVAPLDEKVSRLRARLREEVDHRGDIDAVAVVDGDGRFVDDIALFDLAIAKGVTLMEELVGDGSPPVTVRPDAELDEVAERLTEARRSSLVVTDENGEPIGRILADDVVDALLPERGRFHFPRRRS
jgi:CBS domain-containing protein